MAKLLLTILHFLSDKLRALIVIIAVLLVGAWLQHEWQALEQAQQNTAHQQQVKALLQARHQELVKAQQQAEKLSDAAAYIGEMSLMDSINSIAAARGLCARVHFLAPIAIEDHTRREVAVQAEAQIALSLGVNNPRSSSPTEDAQAPNA